MNKTNRTRYMELLRAESVVKYPNLPEHARVLTMPTDKTANGLTRLIIKWIEMNGYQAERINTMGRMVDKRKIVTDVLGRKGMIGSMSYIPTTGTKGSADVSATIYGRSVKIEVKIGNDRQSANQKAYEQAISKAGGTYLIVKTFDHFMDWWDREELNDI